MLTVETASMFATSVIMSGSAIWRYRSCRLSDQYPLINMQTTHRMKGGAVNPQLAFREKPRLFFHDVCQLGRSDVLAVEVIQDGSKRMLAMFCIRMKVGGLLC